MKKLKLWMVAMVAIMTSVALTSCGDDDKKGDEPDVIDSPIVGTWYYESVYEWEANDYRYVETITFKSNGTYEWTEIEYELDEDEEWKYSENGTYSINKNTLTTKCTKISTNDVEGYGPISSYVGEINNHKFEIAGRKLTIYPFGTGSPDVYTRR